jgi:hypothetical protein
MNSTLEGLTNELEKEGKKVSLLESKNSFLKSEVASARAGVKTPFIKSLSRAFHANVSAELDEYADTPDQIQTKAEAFVGIDEKKMISLACGDLVRSRQEGTRCLH